MHESSIDGSQKKIPEFFIFDILYLIWLSFEIIVFDWLNIKEKNPPAKPQR